MEAQKIRTYADLITGPFSALIISAGLLYMILSYIPTVIDRHFESIDKMIESHNQDRELYRDSMEQITIEISKLSNSLH